MASDDVLWHLRHRNQLVMSLLGRFMLLQGRNSRMAKLQASLMGLLVKACGRISIGCSKLSKKLKPHKADSTNPILMKKRRLYTILDPRGFIYENKDKKNRLMRIDVELHKFSDGTLAWKFGDCSE
ncbi:hypothetical protein Tco_0697739 [Tanacetum coccineum]